MYDLPIVSPCTARPISDFRPYPARPAKPRRAGPLLALYKSNRPRYTRRWVVNPDSQKGRTHRGVADRHRARAWRVQRDAGTAVDSGAGRKALGTRSDGMHRGAQSPRGRLVSSMVGG